MRKTDLHPWHYIPLVVLLYEIRGVFINASCSPSHATVASGAYESFKNQLIMFMMTNMIERDSGKTSILPDDRRMPDGCLTGGNADIL